MPRPALPVLEREARNRMRLVTPDTAVKVVSRDIYWTVPFLRLFLERCDDLGVDNTHEALKLAHFAPRLAQLIGVGGRPGEYISSEQKHSYEVLALAVLGSLCRRANKIGAAEGHFAHAFVLADRRSTAAFALGELLRRYGLLRAMLAKTDAMAHLDRAVAVLRESGRYRDSMASALNTRGHVLVTEQRWQEASLDFEEAVECADLGTSIGKKTASAAVVNLAFTISAGSLRLDERARILEFVKTIRKDVGTRASSEMKARLLWMEGWLYHQLSFDRHAARVLRRARKSFRSLDRPIEFAVVSLDLAMVLLADGEHAQYERLRAETEAALEQFANIYPQLHEALVRWQATPAGYRSVSRLTEIKATLQR